MRMVIVNVVVSIVVVIMLGVIDLDIVGSCIMVFRLVNLIV